MPKRPHDDHHVHDHHLHLIISIISVSYTPRSPTVLVRLRHVGALPGTFLPQESETHV
eukprot:NODE_30153_length_426_cov_1.652174.p3 GENE.NODE_30153_length_426_cov_1.652174~~NODE_30153_length_426_cov_1.652174.p3  ORF type:complete len:58 (-),score=2.01 NODE_30153_length_426_cov_1.652174:79-252(-)